MESARPMEYRFLLSPAPREIAQIVSLYKENGWWDAGDEQPGIVRGIVGRSHCFLAVFLDGNLIGMGRAISDGTSDAYIQDVTVRASFRGRGIGSGIVRRIVDRLHADGLFWIGLIAEGDSRPFYERLGFSPMEHAAPMLLKGKP
ncbi:MAG: Acetyltransferase (GNAT) family protein [Syntrophaceae bacterium PtaU1.Bin231]|nr:MAG: Acetyltransferase (GNAT) family protein [Syntrophaceae bacterium PtaU1.Bin231]